MPVIHIRSLRPPQPEQIQACMDAVVRGVAHAMAREEWGVWVQWEEVQRMHVGTEPRAFYGHCPVVTIRARPGRPRPAIEGAMAACAAAISETFRIPVEDVWIHWQEIPKGYIYAGGGVR